ncbi:MAG: hypothetical protein ABH825_02140 [Candidatus Omnitrophota bacterium]
MKKPGRFLTAALIAISVFSIPQGRALWAFPGEERAAGRKSVEYFDEASKCAGQKDWFNAIENMLRAYELDSKNTAIKENLAIFYNNWAMQFMEEDELDAARDRLEKAIAYDGQNRAIKTNLSYVLLKKAHNENRRGYAELSLSLALEAVKADPENADGYVFLGNLYYDRDNFEDAASNWKTAIDLGHPQKKAISDKLNKLKSEEKVEKDFLERWTRYFKIKFEGRRRDDLVYRVSDKLIQAYRDIGWYFEYYPKAPTTVIIYTDGQFSKATGSPDWTLGLYDGKIRLRLGDITSTEDMLKKLIYHEYAHALVYRMFPNNIPVWLHEGIAGWSEDPEFRLQGVEKIFFKDIISRMGVLGFEELNGCFHKTAPSDKRALGYLQTKLFVQYFMSRYNRYYLKELLAAMNSGDNFAEAAEKAVYIGADRLYDNFLEYLRRVL